MERPVLLLKKVWPKLGIHSLELVGRDPAIMGMLKNAASGVPLARNPSPYPQVRLGFLASCDLAGPVGVRRTGRLAFLNIPTSSW